MKVFLSLLASLALMTALIFLIKSGISSRFERSPKNGDSPETPSKEKKTVNTWNQLSRGEDPTV